MKDLSTFELILLGSNCLFSLLSGTGPFKEAQERLLDKIEKEAQSRPDYKEAVLAHVNILNTIK